VLGGFEAGRYATQFRMAHGPRRHAIPVSIAYRRDTPLDGSAPLYQYGYGSYGYSIDPRLSFQPGSA
jgi:oligopeptidase B